MVPATGVFWSTVWSTIAWCACATPPPRDAVYSLCSRLEAWVRKLAVCGFMKLCLQFLLSGVSGLVVDATSTRRCSLINTLSR